MCGWESLLDREKSQGRRSRTLEAGRPEGLNNAGGTNTRVACDEIGQWMRPDSEELCGT